MSCLSIPLDQSTGVNLKLRKCILINLNSVVQFKWSWNLSGYVSSVRHVNERFVLSIVFILHFTFGLTDSWIGFELQEYFAFIVSLRRNHNGISTFQTLKWL